MIREPLIFAKENWRKSIERHISALFERSLIEHRGSKKTGGYYAL